MRVAALIIGIIGSAAGFVAAVIALFIGGVGVALEAEGASKMNSLAFGAIGASIVGLVGGALSIAKPRFAAVLMVLSAVVGAISISAFTTAELSLHPYHEAKAGGVAAPNNPRHSAHRPGTEEGRDEPQTAEKTTAGQRARPVHQVPPRTYQAKQGPLRAVLQKDPRIRSQEKSRSQTGQVYRGVSLSHARRAKKARRKPCLLFAASQTGRRATMDQGPAGEKNDGEYTVAARIRTAIVHLGPTIAHLYQRVLYGPYRYDLGGTRVDYSTSFSESVLYGPYCRRSAIMGHI